MSCHIRFIPAKDQIQQLQHHHICKGPSRQYIQDYQFLGGSISLCIQDYQSALVSILPIQKCHKIEACLISVNRTSYGYNQLSEKFIMSSYLVVWIVNLWWFPFAIHLIIPIVGFLGIWVGNMLRFIPILGFFVIRIINLLTFIPVIWLLGFWVLQK